MLVCDDMIFTLERRIAVGQPPLVGEVAVVYRWIYLYKTIREGIMCCFRIHKFLHHPIRLFDTTLGRPISTLYHRHITAF